MKKNIANIKRVLNNPTDLIAREVIIGNTHRQCGVVCIDGLVDKALINDKILKTLQLGLSGSKRHMPATANAVLDLLQDEILPAAQVRTVHTLDDVMLSVLTGDTAVFIDGTDTLTRDG